MKPFNLAESRILEAAYCRALLMRQARGIVLILVVMIVVITPSSAWKMMITSKLTQSQSRLEDASKKYEAGCTTLSSGKSVDDQLKWRDKLHDSIQMGSNALNVVSYSAPNDVFLAKAQALPDNGLFTVEGSAASFDSLVVFVSRLKDCAAFSDVRMVNTKQSGSAANAQIHFSLQMTLRGAGKTSAQSQDVPKL